MWTWATAGAAGAAGVLGASAAAFLNHRSKRQRIYRELACIRGHAIAGLKPRLRPDIDPLPFAASFAAQHIVRVDDFLDSVSLDLIRAEAIAASPKKKRSYVPTHKKGGTVSYEAIHRLCPHALAFYHSASVPEFVSRVVGMKVGSAGDHDLSAESILYYQEEGDHIHWHFDHNCLKNVWRTLKHILAKAFRTKKFLRKSKSCDEASSRSSSLRYGRCRLDVP